MVGVPPEVTKTQSLLGRGGPSHPTRLGRYFPYSQRRYGEDGFYALGPERHYSGVCAGVPPWKGLSGPDLRSFCGPGTVSPFPGPYKVWLPLTSVLLSSDVTHQGPTRGRTLPVVTRCPFGSDPRLGLRTGRGPADTTQCTPLFEGPNILRELLHLTPRLSRRLKVYRVAFVRNMRWTLKRHLQTNL